MNDIADSLQKIGLSDKEAKIYLALLKFGEASVSDIAEEGGIKRPTAYLILDELRKKGLVIKIPYAKKIMFKAKTPDDLYEQSISNINQFEKVLPRLRAMAPSKQAIKTLYFEGLEGISDALSYRIEDLRGTIDEGFWAKNDGNIPVAVMGMFHKWNKALEKNNIIIGGVTPKHESTQEFVDTYKKNTVIQAPLEDYDSDISIEVTEKFVRILDGHNLKAIIIENDRISHALKQIFDLAKRNYVKKEEAANTTSLLG
jgi:predicted DNA-binding transcriptional regulator